MSLSGRLSSGQPLAGRLACEPTGMVALEHALSPPATTATACHHRLHPAMAHASTPRAPSPCSAVPAATRVCRAPQARLRRQGSECDCRCA
eukprot:scaffold49181_cov35-Phaeocystis_antarctica.AAC.1